MTPTLLALHLAAAPAELAGLTPPPALQTSPLRQGSPLRPRSLARLELQLAPAPWSQRSWSQRPWSHGPDGPDDVPEDGYEFKASKKKEKKKFMWVGMGAIAVSGVTAASARSQSYVMREAQSMAELDAAYTKQKNLAYTTYTLLGVGALCFVLEIPF